MDDLEAAAEGGDFDAVRAMRIIDEWVEHWLAHPDEPQICTCRHKFIVGADDAPRAFVVFFADELELVITTGICAECATTISDEDLLNRAAHSAAKLLGDDTGGRVLEHVNPAPTRVQ
jgi:hypothetical protein